MLLAVFLYYVGFQNQGLTMQVKELQSSMQAADFALTDISQVAARQRAYAGYWRHRAKFDEAHR